MTWPVVHLTRSIRVAPATVAAFAGNPANLPRWAGGLSTGIREEEGRWYTDSPMGVVEVAFSGDREAGILDHDVTLPDGTAVHNPLRVLPNDGGSEVVFSLFRLPGVTDEEFAADAAHVRADLDRLAQVLETEGTPQESASV